MNVRNLSVAMCSVAAMMNAASGQAVPAGVDAAGPVASLLDGACPDRVTSDSVSGGATTARINRNGVASACGVAKPFPGTIAGAFRYQTFAFTNPTAAAECVTITLSSTCEDLMVSAYLGAFNPANLAQNYLGDAGNSILASSFQQRTFRVTVPGNQTLVVVVQETAANQSCVGFRLGVQGFGCQTVQNPLVLSGTSISNAVVGNWPVGFGETTGARLERDGGQSQCGVGRACPGSFGAAGNRSFRLYPLVNNSGGARCVTVELNSSCAAGAPVQVVARNALPDVVDPCAGFLADAGRSVGAGTQSSFSLVMQPDQLVWLQVFEVDPAEACTNYTLRIKGLSPDQPFQYANCDGSTVFPQLNALDFACFLQRYQAGILSGN